MSRLPVTAIHMEDPTFEVGVAKVATAQITNTGAVEFVYTFELYLGVSKTATSGVITATMPAGSTVPVIFPITMPLVEGDYPVYLDVWHEATLLVHGQASENVVIEATPGVDIGDITWG